jgi:hypothetical protein
MAEWPTTPEPPVRLTTLTGWPRSFSIRLPIMRATASVPPPAPQGTISVIGREFPAAHPCGRVSSSVLIIDEAQNLSADVLEQLRLLTNLETSQRKLLQIILIGQPELRDMLARPDLEQLAQRVIARFHLGGDDRGRDRPVHCTPAWAWPATGRAAL